MALICGTCAVVLAAVVARLISSPRAGAAGRLLAAAEYEELTGEDGN